MKTRNILAKYGRKLGAIGAVTVAATGQAYAAASAEATAAADALSANSDNISAIGWAALGLLVVAAAFKYMRRTV